MGRDLVEDLGSRFGTAGSDQPVDGLQPFPALIDAVATQILGYHITIVIPRQSKNKVSRSYSGGVRHQGDHGIGQGTAGTTVDRVTGDSGVRTLSSPRSDA